MLRTIVLATALCAAAPAAAQHAAPAALPDSIESYATRLVQGEVHPALVVAVRDPSGAVSVEGFGALVDGAAPDAQTVFEWGSISKALNGLLLAEMVGRGEVSLQTPLAALLPDTIQVPWAETVTLMHLATHTSGLPRLPATLMAADPDDPFGRVAPADLFESLESTALEAEPGARYTYSNLGAAVLGQALARVAGQPYTSLVEERVLAPMGLAETGFALAPAQPHRDSEPVPAWTWDGYAPTGGLRGTASDLLRLAQALTDPSGPLAEAADLATEPRAEAGGPMRVGLGWHVRTGDPSIVWHNGGTGGSASFVGVDPDTGHAVAVLANSGTSVTALGFHLLDPAVPLPPVRPFVEVPEDVLQGYVGTYALAPGFVIEVTREAGRLFAQLTGQARFRVFPVSDTRFFYRVVEAELEFAPGPDGQAERVTLFQNGAEMPAARVE